MLRRVSVGRSRTPGQRHLSPNQSIGGATRTLSRRAVAQNDEHLRFVPWEALVFPAPWLAPAQTPVICLYEEWSRQGDHAPDSERAQKQQQYRQSKDDETRQRLTLITLCCPDEQSSHERRN